MSSKSSFPRQLTLAVAVLVAATGKPAAATAPSPSYRAQRATPNSCIRLNHGDFNACNVGNSGRGDLPYRRVGAADRSAVPGAIRTPNDCIRINHGDFNACNVGNSGRGDLPYRRSR